MLGEAEIPSPCQAKDMSRTLWKSCGREGQGGGNARVEGSVVSMVLQIMIRVPIKRMGIIRE